MRNGAPGVVAMPYCRLPVRWTISCVLAGVPGSARRPKRLLGRTMMEPRRPASHSRPVAPVSTSEFGAIASPCPSLRQGPAPVRIRASPWISPTRQAGAPVSPADA